MLKRSMDMLLATIALILLAPLILMLALLVRIFLGSPVFYCQRRAGQDGRPFHIIKFRTMSDSYNPDGELLSDELRISKLGNILRSFSLDELPELVNVIRGDMSLVGPRPLLMEYLPLYKKFQMRRHEVRPGITGWAQVNGRNALTWEEKFELDVWYVDNQSLWVDVKILFLTIKQVLLRDGISAEGEATMPQFKGSDTTDAK